MAACASQSNGKDDSSENKHECRICWDLLIEPVQLPCPTDTKHSICYTCYTDYCEKTPNTLCLPCGCGGRMETFARRHPKKEQLVDQTHWALIRKHFPREVARRAKGEDAIKPNNKVVFHLAEPGELRKEYEEEMRKMEEERRQEHLKEEEASRRAIEKMQLLDRLEKNDSFVARQIQDCVNDSVELEHRLSHLRTDFELNTHVYSKYNNLPPSASQKSLRAEDLVGYEPGEKPEKDIILYDKKDVEKYSALVRAQQKPSSSTLVETVVIDSSDDDDAPQKAAAESSSIPDAQRMSEDTESRQSFGQRSMTPDDLGSQSYSLSRRPSSSHFPSSSNSLSEDNPIRFRPISAAPVTPPRVTSQGLPIPNELVRVPPVRIELPQKERAKRAKSPVLSLHHGMTEDQVHGRTTDEEPSTDQSSTPTPQLVQGTPPLAMSSPKGQVFRMKKHCRSMIDKQITMLQKTEPQTEAAVHPPPAPSRNVTVRKVPQRRTPLNVFNPTTDWLESKRERRPRSSYSPSPLKAAKTIRNKMLRRLRLQTPDVNESQELFAGTSSLPKRRGRKPLRKELQKEPESQGIIDDVVETVRRESQEKAKKAPSPPIKKKLPKVSPIRAARRAKQAALESLKDIDTLLSPPKVSQGIIKDVVETVRRESQEKANKAPSPPVKGSPIRPARRAKQAALEHLKELESVSPPKRARKQVTPPRTVKPRQELMSPKKADTVLTTEPSEPTPAKGVGLGAAAKRKASRKVEKPKVRTRSQRSSSEASKSHPYVTFRKAASQTAPPKPRVEASRVKKAPSRVKKGKPKAIVDKKCSLRSADVLTDDERLARELQERFNFEAKYRLNSDRRLESGDAYGLRRK